MDDQPCRFLDDDEILVLIDDVEGNILALRHCGRWRRDIDRIGLTGFDPEIAVSYRFARMADGAAFDQLLKARAADIAQRGREKTVEAPAGLLCTYHSAARPFIGGFGV